MADPIRAALERLVETIEGIELEGEGFPEVDEALAAARAALAEPELEGPTDEELEALADQFWVENSVNFEAEHYAFARAVLARWGRPVTPTAGEVGFSATWDTVAIIAQDMRARGLAEQAAGEELLKAATANRNRADSTTPPTPAAGEVGELVQALIQLSDGMGGMAQESGSWVVARAAALLERQQPQPVPVSERLPGPEDCASWPGEPEATPWCWAGKDIDGGWEWSQISMLGLSTDTLSRIIAGGGWTHWLPAHALPIPQQES